jgi:hypothetical protein
MNFLKLKFTCQDCETVIVAEVQAADLEATRAQIRDLSKFSVCPSSHKTATITCTHTPDPNVIKTKAKPKPKLKPRPKSKKARKRSKK